MNELTSLGLILLFALLVGHLVKFARVPEVTGYLLAESALTGLAVTGGMLAVGQPWPVALLLGTIAISTGAASTLMVIRENNAAGPFTETLTGVIAVNNIVALVVFSLAAAALDLGALAGGAGAAGGGVLRAVFPLVWQLAGSAALGYLVGILLASWASQVVESGEVLILLAGCVLLTVGAATALDLSPLVASLAVGTTLANLSARSRRLFEALSRTDPPLYVIFFVLAGADLNLALLPSLGLLGAAYVLCRVAGKAAGAWLGARRARAERPVQRLLGLAIFAQAGLAVGLVLVARERFPAHAATVSTVVLGGVVVFEIVGPLAARFALDRSGESRPHGAAPPLPAD